MGLLGWQMPEVLSEGYDVTQKFLLESSDYALVFVLLFVVLKTTIALAEATKGLVGHWHLDEGTGKIAKDSSTEKNDG